MKSGNINHEDTYMKILTEIWRENPREIKIQRVIDDGIDKLTHETIDRKNWKEELIAKELMPKSKLKPWDIGVTDEELMPEEDKPKKKRSKAMMEECVDEEPDEPKNESRGRKPSGKVLVVSGTWEEKKSQIEKAIEHMNKDNLKYLKCKLRKPCDDCPDGYRMLIECGQEKIYEVDCKISLARIEKA